VSVKRRSICLISGGIIEQNVCLQPWRYLHEVSCQLIQQNHQVTILSDGLESHPPNDTVATLPIQRLESIGSPRVNLSTLVGTKHSTNKELTAAIQDIDPDIILWHINITSLLHQQISGWPGIPIIGILTSPFYNFADLQRIGLNKIIKSRDLSAMHIAGTLLPKQFMESAINSDTFDKIVVQTQTTRNKLIAHNVDETQIIVISPGVDQSWFRSADESIRTTSNKAIEENRQTLGYSPDDKVVLYYGSASPCNGLHTLIRAVEIAREQDESIRLLILSCYHTDQLMSEDEELQTFLNGSNMQQYTQFVDGFLEPETLVEFVSSADVVALPFEFISSDAPLTLLESKALGKPIVTTNVACLPELVAGSSHYIAEPSDPISLAQALLQAAKDLPETRIELKNSQVISSAEFDHGTPLRDWETVGEEWSHLIQNL